MSQEENKQQAQMRRGTLWLTVGNFASRLLGAIYIIPWYTWMGAQAPQANALFSKGYNIYAMFLLISTVGLNVAVAKQISKYNSMEKPEMSYKLIRSFLVLMLLLGLGFALTMFVGAPIFAGLSGGGKGLIPVMHSLSWAVLVFPAMSVMRGIFQGFNDMKPYALSQVAEQIVRVIWMLLTTFFIMKMGSGNYVEAVIQSTFAAFIGMIASVGILVYYLIKAGIMPHILQVPETDETIDTKTILVETFKEAIPFIITGSAIQIFQLIDQFTFINSMKIFTNHSQDELDILYAYFTANPNKVIMILIAVATAIGGVGIPLLTENFVKKNTKASAKLIVDSLTMLLVFLLPAVSGATLLSKSLYTVFYDLPDQDAIGLFILSMMSTLVLGLYTVLSPMIQALFENRNAVKYFLYGVVVKLVLQIPFIFLFHAYGPLISTLIGLLVPIVLMFKRLVDITDLDVQLLAGRTLMICAQTLIMILLVGIIEVILKAVYPVTGRIPAIMHLLVSGALGGGTYAMMSLMSHSIDFIIGKPKAQTLRRKFKLE